MAKSRLNILISAGPTVEPLDPVRYMSNRSSGKMGYALAEAALAERHKVTLVSGPTNLPEPKCKVLQVQTAREMREAMLKAYDKADVVFMAAAVADYRPFRVPLKKIKKKLPLLSMVLIKNPDILKELGRRKKDQVLVGFAAETHDWVKNAKKKINDKKLDWIVLNDVSRSDIGFESQKNEVHLINAQGDETLYKKQAKTALAKKILKRVSK